MKREIFIFVMGVVCASVVNIFGEGGLEANNPVTKVQEIQCERVIANQVIATDTIGVVSSIGDKSVVLRLEGDNAYVATRNGSQIVMIRSESDKAIISSNSGKNSKILLTSEHNRAEFATLNLNRDKSVNRMVQFSTTNEASFGRIDDGQILTKSIIPIKNENSGESFQHPALGR